MSCRLGTEESYKPGRKKAQGDAKRKAMPGGLGLDFKAQENGSAVKEPFSLNPGLGFMLCFRVREERLKDLNGSVRGL